jgi:hypothetical protein
MRNIPHVISVLSFGFLSYGAAESGVMRHELLSKALVIDERCEITPKTNINQEEDSALICVDLEQAQHTSTTLKRDLKGVETIYTSKRENAACFLVHDHFDVVETVASKLPHTLVAPIPNEAKLSTSLFPRMSAYHEEETSDLVLNDLFLRDFTHKIENIKEKLDKEEEEKFFKTKENLKPKVLTNKEKFKKKLRASNGFVLHFPPGVSTVDMSREMNGDWSEWIESHITKPLTKLSLSNKNHDDENKKSKLWFSKVMNDYSSKNEQNLDDMCKFDQLFINEVNEKTVELQGFNSLLSNTGDHVEDRKALQHCLITLMTVLMETPKILRISPIPVHTTLNGRGAKLMQTSDNAASAYDDETPIWNLGINGTGQIVGVADTGLDLYSCYFSSYSGAPTVTASPSSSPTYDLSQPKVVQYITYTDAYDEEEGHGSHVVGTVLGDIGSGWTNVASSADTCSSSTDIVTDCTLPEYYSNCADYTSYCNTDFADGGVDEGACANTCNCELGYYLRTGSTSGSGQTCGELLEDNKGVAFGAKVAFFDLGDSDGGLYTPSNLETGLFPSAYSTGARVHSNSWGSADTYSYDTEDLQVDSYAYDNTDFLILFAAGNDGEYGSATTVTSPSQAKNALIVGASETGRFPTSPDMNNNPSYVASFSSSGPTSDGRIKPDLVAPGYSIISAKAVGYSNTATCAVYATQGTSMATPGAAGAAALVRDYLTSTVFSDHLRAVSDDISWTCLPGYVSCETGLSLDGDAVSALVKAMLIHGTAEMTYWDAEDSGGTGYLTASSAPDNYQGFGRIDLSGSLFSSTSLPSGGSPSIWLTDDGSISSSTSISYTFHLISSAEPLKATLVWCDPPNSVGASKQLLHDLDLTVTDETTSTTYYSNGNSAADDEDNNVEKVWIASPSTSDGDYTITVTSSVLTESSTQAFALVISGVGYYVEDGYTWAVIAAGEVVPTPLPSITPLPTFPPSPAPTQKPTPVPTPQPTISFRPTDTPTPVPSPAPTITFNPTSSPTAIPTSAPTQNPVKKKNKSSIKNLLSSNLVIIGVGFVLGGFVVGFIILRCCCGKTGSRADNRRQREADHNHMELNRAHAARHSSQK